MKAALAGLLFASIASAAHAEVGERIRLMPSDMPQPYATR